MMNYIWGGMIIISLIVATVQGRLDATISEGIHVAGNSVAMVLSFAGVMCMWSGIMKIAEDGGLAEIIGKILSPITRILFPKLQRGSKAIRSITMNITANILGMGNAATPLGLQAMEELDHLNKSSNRASNEMCIFVVLNTASFQLVPTTLIALRTASGSANPFEIILPVWIASACSAISAIVVAKLLLHWQDNGGRKKCK